MPSVVTCQGFQAGSHSRCRNRGVQWVEIYLPGGPMRAVLWLCHAHGVMARSASDYTPY